MKCNLIIPGFAKCGTTSLHQYLDQHPDICMSGPRKEPHFFTFATRYNKGHEEHDRLFEKAAPNTLFFGEASTSYCVWEPALARIRDSISNVKLIILLREPVERLVSHYNWMYTLGLETDSLEVALRHELGSDANLTDNREGCFPWYFRHSRYDVFGPLIESMFPAANILYLSSEDLRLDNLNTLNQAMDFLGLKRFQTLTPVTANVTSKLGAKRKLGLGYVHSILRPLVPTRLLDQVDPDRRVWKFITSLTGRKRPKIAPKPSPEVLEWIRGELEDATDFYQSKTRRSY